MKIGQKLTLLSALVMIAVLCSFIIPRQNNRTAVYAIAFYNLDFMYVFDYDNKELRVYEGDKLLKRQDMEVLYW